MHATNVHLPSEEAVRRRLAEVVVEARTLRSLLKVVHRHRLRADSVPALFPLTAEQKETTGASGKSEVLV